VTEALTDPPPETEIDYILFSSRGEIEVTRDEFNWIITGLLNLVNQFEGQSEEYELLIASMARYRASSVEELLEKLERIQSHGSRK